MSLFDVLNRVFPPKSDDVRGSVNRNDACWCGSGRKYKACHMDADEKKKERKGR
jgi:uncharacterized protein YecA (UPF0149 family)